MINVNKLKGRMAEKNLTGVDMAKIIGKTPKTFYSKMKKGVFGSDEIDAMAEALELTNPADFFYAKQVTQ